MANTPKKPGTDVTAPPAAEVAVDYGEDVGVGFTDLKATDYAVPFLVILQKLSPQCDEAGKEFIPEAKPGMLFNTATKQLYPGDTGVGFIPVHASHQYTEWVPLTQGGGFVGTHAVDAAIVLKAIETAGGQRFGKLVTEKGNELVECYYVYGILLAPDGPQQVVLAFSSTQIKKFKAWMTHARTIMVTSPTGRKVNPPMFAHVWRLASKPEENNKGKWSGWNITLYAERASECRLPPENEQYQMAKSFRDLAVQGLAKAQTEGLTSKVVEAEVVADGQSDDSPDVEVI